MNQLLRYKLHWLAMGIVAMGMLLWALPRDRNPRLPATTDAFLSYLQAAHALAQTLLRPPPSPGKERPAELTAACLELAKLQAAADELKPEEIRRLTVEHAAVARQAKQSWQELASRHRHTPSFPGPEWPDYERAFVFCTKVAGP